MIHRPTGAGFELHYLLSESLGTFYQLRAPSRGGGGDQELVAFSLNNTITCT